ncbi:unnamed protein product [Arctogadus glacialis]
MRRAPVFVVSARARNGTEQSSGGVGQGRDRYRAEAPGRVAAGSRDLSSASRCVCRPGRDLVQSESSRSCVGRGRDLVQSRAPGRAVSDRAALVQSRAPGRVSARAATWYRAELQGIISTTSNGPERGIVM